MFHDLHDCLEELVIFQALYKDDVFCAFQRFTRYVRDPGVDWWCVTEEYYDFVRCLYARHTVDWTAYLRDLVLSAETPLDWYVINDQPIPPTMMQSVKRELSYLSEAASLSSTVMKKRYITMEVSDFPGHVGLQPDWEGTEIDLEPLY
ncbi:MAG: hypothetical protein IKN55_03820, partial [Oscillospiraceae bacterium]|nr:hypothetical protein [Oscillospiraceae bacterium]